MDNKIYWNADYSQIKIPCMDEPDKVGEIAHFFTITLNVKRKRFELLDSLGGKRYELFFFRMVGVLKELWRLAAKESGNELSPPSIDDFKCYKIYVPDQGET